MDLQEAALIGLSVFGLVMVIAMVWIIMKLRKKA
jgi:hypothetical protein